MTLKRTIHRRAQRVRAKARRARPALPHNAGLRIAAAWEHVTTTRGGEWPMHDDYWVLKEPHAAD